MIVLFLSFLALFVYTDLCSELVDDLSRRQITSDISQWAATKRNCHIVDVTRTHIGLLHTLTYRADIWAHQTAVPTGISLPYGACMVITWLSVPFLIYPSTRCHVQAVCSVTLLQSAYTVCEWIGMCVCECAHTNTDHYYFCFVLFFKHCA